MQQNGDDCNHNQQLNQCKPPRPGIISKRQADETIGFIRLMFNSAASAVNAILTRQGKDAANSRKLSVLHRVLISAPVPSINRPSFRLLISAIENSSSLRMFWYLNTSASSKSEPRQTDDHYLTNWNSIIPGRWKRRSIRR